MRLASFSAGKLLPVGMRLFTRVTRWHAELVDATCAAVTFLRYLRTFSGRCTRGEKKEYDSEEWERLSRMEKISERNGTSS